MVRMESYPSDGGRSTMRSKAIMPKDIRACQAMIGNKGTFSFVVPALVA